MPWGRAGVKQSQSRGWDSLWNREHSAPRPASSPPQTPACPWPPAWSAVPLGRQRTWVRAAHMGAQGETGWWWGSQWIWGSSSAPSRVESLTGLGSPG